MVSPQDTYEAGLNGNEVLGPNPGTNILTTNTWHLACHTIDVIYETPWKLWYSPRQLVKDFHSQADEAIQNDRPIRKSH